MKQFFQQLINQLKCSHDYKYQSTEYQKKLSRSENPFYYTEIYIYLKCSICDKKIKRDYRWCETNNLPTHEPIRIDRRRGRLTK